MPFPLNKNNNNNNNNNEHRKQTNKKNFFDNGYIEVISKCL